MPRWTEEKKTGSISSHGYRLITINGKRQYEHRYVMSQFLKRPLKRVEQIDHLNGNKLDNRIENLQLIDITTHLRIEHKRGIYKNNIAYVGSRAVNRSPKVCKKCGISFFKIKRWRTRRFCSNECKNLWMKDWFIQNNPNK